MLTMWVSIFGMDVSAYEALFMLNVKKKVTVLERGRNAIIYNSLPLSFFYKQINKVDCL